MQDIYYVENIEQLKVFSDTLRLKILREISSSPKTSKMLSVILELSPSKVNYHLTELERVGLAYIVKTELKNGIQQKFYAPFAKKISLDKIDELINHDNETNQNSELNKSVKDIVTNSLSITSNIVKQLENINDRFVHMGQNIKLSPEHFSTLEQKILDIYQFIKTNHDPNLDIENGHFNMTFIPKGD